MAHTWETFKGASELHSCARIISLHFLDILWQSYHSKRIEARNRYVTSVADNASLSRSAELSRVLCSSPSVRLTPPAVGPSTHLYCMPLQAYCLVRTNTLFHRYSAGLDDAATVELLSSTGGGASALAAHEAKKGAREHEGNKINAALQKLEKV